LLPDQLQKLPELNRIRQRNAGLISRALEANPEFVVPKPAAGCEPTYIRFPLLARDAGTRNEAVRALRHAGIGASAFYPTALCDIPGIGDFVATRDFHQPQAEIVSQRLLTLPTHHFVRREDVDTMVRILNRC
jgi:dTDP-4-amino-4,6-dideoxygalactose transaminase